MQYLFDRPNHVHKLDDKPLIGTTTALEVISKPLTWWASGMACKVLGWLHHKEYTKEQIFEAASAMLEKIKAMTVAEFVALLNRAYRAHKDELERTADKGVDLHSEIEKYIRYCLDTAQGRPVETIGLEDERIKPFIAWAISNVKQFLWSELHHYDETLWVGGISDFGYLDMQDRLAIGDIKSSPKAYFSHFLQAASYDLQLSKNGGFTPDGKKIFELPKPIAAYAIFPFGGGFKEPTIVTQIVPYRYGFKSALQLYRLRKEFEGDAA